MFLSWSGDFQSCNSHSLEKILPDLGVTHPANELTNAFHFRPAVDAEIDFYDQAVLAPLLKRLE